MTDWVNGTVEAMTRWSDKLCSIKVKADLAQYNAGQFGKLSLIIDGERVSRAYSFVNAPDAGYHEFYIIKIPEGRLSPRLLDLQPGESVQISREASGFMTLNEVPEGRDLWMMATGTAIGPFLSILSDRQVFERFDNVVLVHGVREKQDLTYQSLIQTVKSQWFPRFSYIPVVSREDCPEILQGRIPALLINGLLEASAGLVISPLCTQTMLCGNPAMVKDTLTALQQKGLKKNLRREPGHITMENYW